MKPTADVSKGSPVTKRRRSLLGRLADIFGKWHGWLIPIAVVCVLVCGTVGAKLYVDNKNYQLTDGAISSLQLFMGILPNPDLSPKVLNQSEQEGKYLVYVAIIFVVLTYGLFTTEVILAFFSERSKAFSRYYLKNHVIVCGFGYLGRAEVDKHRKRGDRVLIIEKSPTSVLIKQCYEDGVDILPGDATDPEILDAARIERAKLLIALCPTDNTNYEIAASVHERLASPNVRRKPLRCRIQVSDFQTRRTFQQNVKSWHPSTKIQFFDAFDPAARRLLSRDLPLDHAGIRRDDSRQVHLIILGCGRVARALAVRAAQLGVVASRKKIKISIVDNNAQQYGQFLQFHYPQITEICEMHFHSVELISPENRELLQKWFRQDDFITSAVVCMEDEAVSFDMAMKLIEMAQGTDVRLAAHIMTQTGILRLLEKDKTLFPGGEHVNFQVFGFSHSGLEDKGELYAQAFHSAYVKSQKKEEAVDTAKFNDPSLQEWDELVDDLRESNEQQFDHLHIKLRAIGMEIAEKTDTRSAIKEFSPDEVELLAEMEHRRWLAERRLSNWTYAEKKDVLHRQSNSLVPWERLTDKVRDFNRNEVKEIPSLLESAGMKICKI